MMRILITVVLMSLVQAAAGQVTYTWRYYSKTLSDGRTGYYSVGMPSDSATNTNKRPVFCFEPGAGETFPGSGGVVSEATATKYGYSRDVKMGLWDGGITQSNGYSDSVVYPIYFSAQSSGMQTSTLGTTRTRWRAVWEDYEVYIDYDQIHFGGLSLGGRNILYMASNVGNSAGDPYVFGHTPVTMAPASPGGKSASITNNAYYIGQYVHKGGRVFIATGQNDNAGAYLPSELLPYFNDTVANSAIGYAWQKDVNGFTDDNHCCWDTLFKWDRTYWVLGGKSIIQWQAQYTKAPKAAAQSVINTTGSTVTLNGVTNGWYKTVAWTRISGTGTITSASSDTTSVTGLSVGTSIYRLTVTNTNDSRTATHDVTVNVTAAALPYLKSAPRLSRPKMSN